MSAWPIIALLLVAACVHGADPDHWSLQPVKRPGIPTAGPSTRNVIDAFIDAGLSERGLVRSNEAEPIVLIRRLHFLLTGLPPTPEQVEEFKRDPQYELWG